MVPAAATRGLLRSVEDLGPASKASVLFLLARTLYHARNNDDKRALFFFGVALASLRFTTLGWVVQGALYANKFRRQVQV